MISDYNRERLHIGLEVRTPPKAAKFKQPEPKLALYTNWKGQSIVAPPIYPGQKGWYPGIQKKDAKLIATINKQAAKNPYGDPVKRVHSHEKAPDTSKQLK